MIRTFFVELVLPALVFVLILSIAKSFLRGISAAFQARPQPQGRPGPPPVQAGGELKKDPVCGTYVSTATSLHRMVKGQEIYFCSEDCLRKYRA